MSSTHIKRICEPAPLCHVRSRVRPDLAVHFSSKYHGWQTPNHLFEQLNSKFHFTLDPCCADQTAKCSKYFTMRENVLEQDWSKDVVFMNPPFGREIGKWMQKAYRESLDGATVVCLIPSRTDTAWWHDYAIEGQILFLRGRVKFVRNGKAAPAPFPSAIVAFGSNPEALRKSLSDFAKESCPGTVAWFNGKDSGTARPQNSISRFPGNRLLN